MIKNYLLRWIFMIFALLLTAGCCTSPDKSAERIATALATPVIKHVVVKPSEMILSDCETSAWLPPREKYLAMTADEREIALATYSRALQGDFGKCAEKPRNFRTFISDQEKIYEVKK